MSLLHHIQIKIISFYNDIIINLYGSNLCEHYMHRIPYVGIHYMHTYIICIVHMVSVN